MKLDWYKEYWVNSVKTIDYSIDSLWEEGGKTKVRLNKVGLMPMPIDLQFTFKDGSKELHYIPMNLMYGEKPVEDSAISRKVYEAWKWTHATYTVETTRKLADFSIVEKYMDLVRTDVGEINNLKHLRGATTRLLVQRPDNFVFILLNSFSIFLIKKNNSEFISDAKMDFLKGFLKVHEETEEDIPSVKIKVDTFKQKIKAFDLDVVSNIDEAESALFLNLHSKWLTEFINKFAENYA